MIEDVLLWTIAFALVLFGLQEFLTADRRKFANTTIRAATLMIIGLFMLYFAYKFGRKSSPVGY